MRIISNFIHSQCYCVCMMRNKAVLNIKLNRNFISELFEGITENPDLNPVKRTLIFMQHKRRLKIKDVIFSEIASNKQKNYLKA